ncbi:MAG: PAS domain S-box protein [Magnetococcales bacterium]|nr:PAS domain S-box protein [Magnetococcales bacterium]MBF0150808.1 PAS domain S-box protein [Magnetococcales bacterium]
MIRRIRRLFTTSLRRQLVLGIAMVHALLMTLFVFDLVERQRTFLRQQGEEQALSLSQTLATSSTSRVLANDVVGLEEVLRSLLSYPELRYAMVPSPRGKVLGHSERQLTGKYVVDEVSQRLLHGLPNPTIQVSSPQIIDVAAPIRFKERIIAWVRIGLGQSISQERLQLVTLEGLVYTVVAILIGTLFALLMARGLTRGLYQLLEVAEATREGHRGLRTPTERQDELGQLADGFNRMLDALAVKEVSLVQMHHHLETARRQADEANQYLRVSFDKLQQERNKLHTILYSIREGIVLTDAQGTVIMVNPAIEQLLQKKHDQIETEGFFNLVDNPEFVRNCLDHAAEGNSRTLHYKGRELHFHASTFKEHDQAIGSAALIRDVTEEKKIKEQLNEIITKAPFGIIVIDDQGRVRVFNPESSRLFGYTTTEIQPTPPESRRHDTGSASAWTTRFLPISLARYNA